MRRAVGSIGAADQRIDCDQGRREAGDGTDTECPARAEVVGNPTDDRSADRGSPECNANPQRHDSAPHRWLCRELHETVSAICERKGGRTDDHESGRKPPISWRETG